MERFEYEKIRQTLSVLQGASRKVLGPADAWFRPGKPDFARAEELRPFGREETWGGWDCDGWFRFFGTIPREWDGLAVRLEIVTGRERLWNAVNPQFLAYLDGREVCGLDTNHHGLWLGSREDGWEVRGGQRYTVDLDAWSGMVTKPTANAYGSGNEPIWTKGSFVAVDLAVDKFYWDLNVPYEVAGQLPAEDYRRIRILGFLTEAVNRLACGSWAPRPSPPRSGRRTGIWRTPSTRASAA